MQIRNECEKPDHVDRLLFHALASQRIDTLLYIYKTLKLRSRPDTLVVYELILNIVTDSNKQNENKIDKAFLLFIILNITISTEPHIIRNRFKGPAHFEKPSIHMRKPLSVSAEV